MNDISDGSATRPGLRKWLPAGAFLVTLALAVSLSLIYHDVLTARARERFDARTDLVAAALQDRLNDYDMVLRGGAALFATKDEVSRADWRSYIERLDIEHSYPGIQGIGFAKRIAAADLPRHIREVRAEGFPEYTVRPEGARQEYTSIVYLEPFDARNRRAFGYDMFSESVRRTAMERARDTGRTAISGKVKLIQETEADVQPGFLMYLPVYRAQTPSPASPPPLAGARKSSSESLAPQAAGRGQGERLAGYVYAPFRMRNFVEGIVRVDAVDIDLEIYDGTAVAESALLYDTGGCREMRAVGDRPVFTKERLLDLYGRQWKIVFMSLPAFEATAKAGHQVWGPLAAGILISLLVFLFVRELEGTRERAQALATRMTCDLRENERILQESESMWHSLVNANPESVFLADTAGTILAANDTVARRLGRNVTEMIGANIFDFLPSETAATRRKHYEEAIASGKPVRFEDVRNGRYLDNYIHPVADDAGKVVKLAVLGIDVTVIREAELSLIQSHDELEELVRERTAELETARAQAEAATRAKSDFLANMSHELRTPLNSILGFSEIVRDGLAGEMNTQQKEYLNDVWESGSHLLRLINDILDISKIEAGKMELDLGGVDLNHLLEETLVFFREKAARHTISLQLKVAANLPTISADERKIKQVLINLLTNALKFTPDGGEVGVEAAAEAGELRVTVRDTGIGIAAADLDRLFQPFQQLESALTKKHQGTGLGLSLCRKIVELHGGRIGVESTPGAGSRFTFAIPLAPPDHPALAPGGRGQGEAGLGAGT